MIEFYIRDVDFSLFKQGEPVGWTQALTDLSPWSDWPPERTIKLKMPVDEVEFVPIDIVNPRLSKVNIRRTKPVVVNGPMLRRHRLTVKNGVSK